MMTNDIDDKINRESHIEQAHDINKYSNKVETIKAKQRKKTQRIKIKLTELK